MDPKIAFLASGRLFVKLDGHEAREIESQFAKDSLDRQAQRLAIDGWKGRSGVWGSMGMAPPEFSQWQDEAAPRNRVAVRAVSRGASADELYYLLQVGDIHGLFRYDLSKDLEYRLMHRDAFPADSLACHPSGLIAVSMRREDGTVTLAFSKNEGRHWNDVTGGDSVDQSPSWMLDDRKCVVYQSAGIARNQHGAFVGLGPYGIESLDIEGSGEVTRVLEDSDTDYLLPRMTADGTLFCIRRPYKPVGHGEFHPLRLLMDIVLFPFRLLRAIFHFLNLFSMMFSGKPLATGGPRRPDTQHQKYLMLWGHMIDTKQAMKRAGGETEHGLAPKSWELVRHTPEGQTDAVTPNVLSYDLCRDGGVVLTDGTGIWYRDTEGNQRSLCEHSMIESVVVLE